MKPNRFRENLRIIRKARGLTQTELGVRIGFKNHSGLVRIETIGDAPLRTVLKICEALRVSLETLVFAEPFGDLHQTPAEHFGEVERAWSDRDSAIDRATKAEAERDAALRELDEARAENERLALSRRLAAGTLRDASGKSNDVPKTLESHVDDAVDRIDLLTDVILECLKNTTGHVSDVESAALIVGAELGSRSARISELESQLAEVTRRFEGLHANVKAGGHPTRGAGLSAAQCSTLAHETFPLPTEAPALVPREEVMWFARWMELKLRENDHKGGWRDCDPNELQMRAEEELSELDEALGYLDHGEPEAVENVVREAADVANMVMMVADNASRNELPEPTEPTEPKEKES